MLAEDEAQYSLIIKKPERAAIPMSLKIDIKNKKEMPKRFEINLISDEFDKDRMKSVIFEGKVFGKMTNDKFKETLYAKLFGYFRSIKVPIEEVDLGGRGRNRRHAEGQFEATVRNQ